MCVCVCVCVRARTLLGLTTLKGNDSALQKPSGSLLLCEGRSAGPRARPLQRSSAERTQQGSAKRERVGRNGVLFLLGTAGLFPLFAVPSAAVSSLGLEHGRFTVTAVATAFWAFRGVLPSQ